MDTRQRFLAGGTGISGRDDMMPGQITGRPARSRVRCSKARFGPAVEL